MNHNHHHHYINDHSHHGGLSFDTTAAAAAPGMGWNPSATASNGIPSVEEVLKQELLRAEHQAPPTKTEEGQQQAVVESTSNLTHPEWGVIKEEVPEAGREDTATSPPEIVTEFHPLTHKHQRDLESLYQAGNLINDFYFWQANLGGYCMADMTQSVVVSPDGAFKLERRIVEGAPHPGRRKKASTSSANKKKA